MIKRIAITGPESTGKSSLAAALAEHYSNTFVPEYSRKYLEDLGRPYQYEDIAIIAKGQRQQELLIANQEDRFLFCDTEPIVTKIWSEHKYGKCDPWILNEIETNPHDFYLLCDIDLPWMPDPLRENPELREYLFDLYNSELIKRGLPYGIVKGSEEERLHNAIRLLSEWLLK